MSAHPEILWAQRSSDSEADKNVIFLTIGVPELDDSYKLDISGSSISFSGHSSPPKATGTASTVEPKTFSFDLELFGEVVEVKRSLTGKNLSLVLKKKELTEDYWPRLTKDKAKLQWVKTDFSKWKDQDEQDDIPEPEDAGPGAMGGGGMPGMGGMGGAGGAGGMDFASMMQGMGGGGAGGAGGMGGMDMEALMKQMQAGGMGGMGGMGGEDNGPEEEDSDDEGPPALEEA